MLTLRQIKKVEDVCKDVLGQNYFREVSAPTYRLKQLDYERWLRQLYWSLPAHKKEVSDILTTL